MTAPAFAPMVSAAVALLHEPGAVIEVRVLGLDKRRFGVLAGYFDSDHVDALAKAVIGADSIEGANVYLTINPVLPALLARAANRLKDHAKELTGDADIIRRHWLPIDLDPIRPSGIAATDSEHDAAQARAVEVVAFLVAHGVPADALVQIDSGNGAYVFVRVDIAADDNTLALVKRVLAALDLRFTDDVVHVDTGVANAARVMRLPGTTNRKGDGSVDRPHRPTRLVHVPGAIVVCPTDVLTHITALSPEAPQRHHVGNGVRGTFDLDAFIATHLADARGPYPWKDGRKWILPVCKWNAEHTNGAAFVVQFASGAIAARCHHDGCAGKGWSDLREIYEPGIGERRDSGAGPWVHSGNNGRNHPAADPPSARGRIVLLDCATVIPTAVRWAYEGWIPLRAISTMSGEPGLGKSTIAYDFLARLTRGTLPGAFFGTPVPVAIASAEDALDSVAIPRLIAAGADRAEVVAVSVEYNDTTGVLTLTPERLRELQLVLAERRVRFLLLDPVVAYFPGAVDAHRDADVRRVLAPLARLAEDIDAAVLTIIHLNKSKSSNPLVRICGSVAFGAAARSVLLVGRDPANPTGEGRVLAHAKNNYGLLTASRRFTIAERRLQFADIATSKVEWGDEAPDLTAEDLLRDPAASAQPAVTEAAAFLDKLLADGPMSVDDVTKHAEKLGITRASLRRAKRNLGVKSESVKTDHHGKKIVDFWVWRLNRGDTASPHAPVPGAQVSDVEHVEPETPAEQVSSRRSATESDDGFQMSKSDRLPKDEHLEDERSATGVKGADPDAPEVF